MASPPVDVEAEMKVIHERKPGLAANSYRTYRGSLKRLKMVSPSYEVAELTQYLSGLNNAPLARNLITPLLILHPERYRGTFDELHRAAEKIRTNQRPSNAQRKNLTSMREIKRMLRRMREDIKTHKMMDREFLSLKTPEKRLVIAFVSFTLLLDITMRNDAASIKVAKTTAAANKDDSSNYFVISTGTLVLRKFKTARSFRNRGLLPLRLQPTKPTARVLAKYLRAFPTDWLFSLNGKSPLTKAQHSNILTAHSFRYLGVRLGVNMLRHLVLSEFEKTNPSLNERKRQMKRMQQLSLETQMSYAWVDE